MQFRSNGLNFIAINPNFFFSGKLCLYETDFLVMHRCDVCTNGPPEIQDLKVEAMLFLQLIAMHYVGTLDTFVYLSIISYTFYVFHLNFAKNPNDIIALYFIFTKLTTYFRNLKLVRVNCLMMMSSIAPGPGC